MHNLLRLDPSVRIQPKLNNVPQGTQRSRGGLTPTQPLHTLGHHLRVEQCAVLLNPWIAGCRVLSSQCKSAAPNPLPPCCLPHCRLVPHKVSTQQQCAEVSELRVSAPSAHPDVCAESRSLGQDAHGRHSLSRDSVPADRCIGTGRHPSAASHRREYLPSACLPSRRHF